MLLLLMGALLPLASCSQTKFWDDFNQAEKTVVLEQCQSKLIVQYYNGDVTITNTNETQALLSDLVNADIVPLPLSLHILNRFCSDADGAFSEILGKYCTEFVINNAKYLLTYFEEKGNEDLQDLYALFIGTELYFKNEGLSDGKYNYKQFRDALILVKDNTSGLEKTINVFLEKVDKTIKNMD